MHGIHNSGTDEKTRGRRWVTTLASSVALVAMATTVAACGSGAGSDASVASVSTPTTASAGTGKGKGKGDMVAYAQCMRKNGMPDFPDPNPSGGLTLPAGVNPTTPAFKKVESHCRQYLPEGGPTTQDPNAGWSSDQKLRYAECMRANGLPNFPDPDANGGFVIPQGSGIDPKSSTFLKAQEACKKYQFIPQHVQGGPGS